MININLFEGYSEAIKIEQNSIIPINNIEIVRGCCIDADAGTIKLKTAGLYFVSISATATSCEAGELSIQLLENGKPFGMPSTGSAGAPHSSTALHIAKYINVPLKAREDVTELEILNAGACSFFDIDILIARVS